MPDHNWPAEPFSEEGKRAFYKASLARYESTERDARAIRAQGVIWSAGGALVGLLGTGAAFMTYQKTPVPPPMEFVLVHDSTGIVERGVPAKDAPKLFTVATREREMRDFLKACEGYIPQTFARLDYHACMIRAAPDEQKRRAGEIGKGGTRYPPDQGFDWAMPIEFPRFVFQGQEGDSYKYQIRYKRMEAKGAQEAKVAWTANIVFSFHPGAKMDPADRQQNETGFQAESFSTTRD
jgi:hypothetical protein